jgi:8-amino-7-oxononanoate synthase
MAAAAATCALELLGEDLSLVARLNARIVELAAALEHSRVPATRSPTAIQPVIVGTAQRALAASAALVERGFLVPAIRPPTVPEGTSRLRISLSAAHTRDEVEGLAQALAGCLRP